MSDHAADRPGITQAEMAAREEANLRYPASRLVEERGYDEGEGWGFDLLQKSAMLSRRWAVDADAGDVRSWYREQLTARGWEIQKWWPSSNDPVVADWYSKGSQTFVLRLFGRAAHRPFWLYWPDSEQGDTGLHYDITFSEASSTLS